MDLCTPQAADCFLARAKCEGQNLTRPSATTIINHPGTGFPLPVGLESPTLVLGSGALTTELYHGGLNNLRTSLVVSIVGFIRKINLLNDNMILNIVNEVCFTETEL